MQFDAHTRGKHGQCVGNTFVAEWVEMHHRDVCARQTCQIGRTSRRGIDRDIVRAGSARPEVAVPADYRPGRLHSGGIGEFGHARRG